MRYLIITITAALLALTVTVVAYPADGPETDWEITIKYGESMAGVGEARSGQDCAFIWEFSEERKGVRFLGEEAEVNITDLWGVTGDTKGRLVPEGTHPELLVLLMIRVNPVSDDELNVRTAITRWGLISKPPPYTYGFESEVHEHEIRIGDTWYFLGGRGLGDEEHFLEMTIEPVGSKPDVRVRVKPKIAPIKLNYSFKQLDVDRRGITIVKKINLRDIEIEPIKIEVPVEIEGIDSSVINIDIKLKDIFLRDTGKRDEYEMDAVFEVDRMLVVDIVPTDDPSTIQASHMVTSGYNHAVHLKPYKKVRIELPSMESSKYPLETREIIEIEPVVVTRPK